MPTILPLTNIHGQPLSEEPLDLGHEDCEVCNQAKELDRRRQVWCFQRAFLEQLIKQGLVPAECADEARKMADSTWPEWR